MRDEIAHTQSAEGARREQMSLAQAWEEIARLTEEVTRLTNAKEAYWRDAEKQREKAEALHSRLAKCAEFVKWALTEGPWSGCDLDGGGVQDKAEELGLIVKVKYDPDIHGESYVAEPGDDWFVLVQTIDAALSRNPGNPEDPT